MTTDSRRLPSINNLLMDMVFSNDNLVLCLDNKKQQAEIDVFHPKISIQISPKYVSLGRLIQGTSVG